MPGMRNIRHTATSSAQSGANSDVPLPGAPLTIWYLLQIVPSLWCTLLASTERDTPALPWLRIYAFPQIMVSHAALIASHYKVADSCCISGQGHIYVCPSCPFRDTWRSLLPSAHSGHVEAHVLACLQLPQTPFSLSACASHTPCGCLGASTSACTSPARMLTLPTLAKDIIQVLLPLRPFSLCFFLESFPSAAPGGAFTTPRCPPLCSALLAAADSFFLLMIFVSSCTHQREHPTFKAHSGFCLKWCPEPQAWD